MLFFFFGGVLPGLFGSFSIFLDPFVDHVNGLKIHQLPKCLQYLLRYYLYLIRVG